MDTTILTRITSHKKEIVSIYKTLTPEKVIVLFVFLTFSVVSFFVSLLLINQRFLVTVPTYGGSIREGIIGTPRFINPILATGEQDKDLTSLVFAGLTKKDENGAIILDLAESITESDDGLKYDVLIKKNATFHDGVAVTVDDVMYTVDIVQNPLIKSPHRVEWEGVTVQKESDTKLTFTLKKPYPLFMEVLSLGILPKHIWKNLNEDQFSLSDLNIHAIGSGPYAISAVQTESGIPVRFTLTSHEHYTLGRPYISEITLLTYQNEKYLIKAFQDGDISRIHGISQDKVSSLSVSTSSIKTSLLPRTFAVFFNPNKLSPLADKNVRIALQMAINKQAIVDQVLYRYGKVIDNPYPFDTATEPVIYNPTKAKEILLTTKALKNASSTFEITLATANTDEMKKVAEMIQQDWKAVGVEASIAIYEVSDLNQNIIKDRDFQALLFGAITQSPSDLYAFWHSSQRNYPGLNISNYVSKELDKHLEILRESKDEEERNEAFSLVRKEFSEEVPGIFLFSPSLIYITNDKVTTPLPQHSYDTSSRFLFVEKWYRYTDKVWPKTYHKQVLEFIENIIN